MTSTLSDEAAERPPSIELIRLDRIDFHAAELVRERLDKETVAEYRAVLAEGGTLPPITVVSDDGLLLAPDGRHRAAAHAAEGRTEILCEVRQGTQDDALRLALMANTKHGLRRSRADTRKAVELALSHPVYGQQSSREIGRLCRCDGKTVEAVREELRNSATEPDRRVGCDGKAYSPKRARHHNEGGSSMPEPYPVHQREPGDESEEGGADPIPPPADQLKTVIGSAGKSRAGAFDDSQFDKLFGPVTRFVQARAERLNCIRHKRHQEVGTALDHLLTAWKVWQLECPA